MAERFYWCMACERTVVADGDGQYKLIQLPPGSYRVKAAFTNFAAEEKTDLNTIAGQNVKLDFIIKARCEWAAISHFTGAAASSFCWTFLGRPRSTKYWRLMPARRYHRRIQPVLGSRAHTEESRAKSWSKSRKGRTFPWH